MSGTEAAAALLTKHMLQDGYSKDPMRPHKCMAEGCDWSIPWEVSPYARHAEHQAEVLHAAGVLTIQAPAGADRMDVAKAGTAAFFDLLKDEATRAEIAGAGLMLADYLEELGFHRVCADRKDTWDAGFEQGSSWGSVHPGPSGILGDPPINPHG